MVHTLSHYNRRNQGRPPFLRSLREGGSREDAILVPVGFLSSRKRIASGWKEGKGGNRRRNGWRVAGGWIHLSFS